MKINNYQELLTEIKPIRDQLLSHPLYTEIKDQLSLQIFMESHCFAVWDFMSLLKSLQQRLSCVTVPWIPPKSTRAARVINEIVLAEESDEITPGHYRGHFDLYVEAMGEVGADGTPIIEFVYRLRQGEDVYDLLNSLPIPDGTKNFVNTTLAYTKMKDHEVASAFLLGREDVIPVMFDPILTHVETQSNLSCRSFRTYLKRHIELDGDHHSVMGAMILKDLCENNAEKWTEATLVAQHALKARIKLWDGVLAEIRQNLDSHVNISL